MSLLKARRNALIPSRLVCRNGKLIKSVLLVGATSWSRFPLLFVVVQFIALLCNEKTGIVRQVHTRLAHGFPTTNEVPQKLSYGTQSVPTTFKCRLLGSRKIKVVIHKGDQCQNYALDLILEPIHLTICQKCNSATLAGGVVIIGKFLHGMP